MTKGEQARLVAWRLKVLRQAADEENVARVCRRFGMSRKSFYKSGSGATRSTATSSAVVSKILYLRQHYHFGPARIARTCTGFMRSRSRAPQCTAS